MNINPTEDFSKKIDGRRARSVHTRSRIIDSYLDLLRALEAPPTNRQLANMAQCSIRTLYFQFPTSSQLCEAAVRYVCDREAPFTSVSGELIQRILNYSRWCAESWEQWLPLLLVAAQSTKASTTIRSELERQHRLKSSILTSALRPELSAIPQPQCDALLLMIETSTSLDAWARLRRTHGLSIRSGAKIFFKTTMNIVSFELRKLLSGKNPSRRGIEEPPIFAPSTNDSPTLQESDVDTFAR